ncbi:MAG: zinc-dependent alcohol dehydrogenase family protein [candidate division WOR-3 bacterium]|nr:MAG: zinc-dependent alcohol dehydrogenase family protein [candidate division WOR-3 bacterium]
MKAMLLEKQDALENKPLVLRDLPTPEPAEGKIRIKVHVCGACRTDLHIVEGELPAHRMPVVPGHQIIGIVDKAGTNVSRWKPGERAGVPWLYRTCGTCRFCTSGRENLCDTPHFTGYDADGGFAEYMVVDEEFAYRIPDNYTDLKAAPLLCAGVIGYQAFRATGLEDRGKLGLFGFGSSAHIIIQIAVHLGFEVFVVSRTQKELDLAGKLGAAWTGHIDDDMGAKLDAGIVFAPSGELLVKALTKLDKGGRIVSAGIYTTPLPGFDYSYIYPEKYLTSIAHTTRENVQAFLDVVSRCSIQTEINQYALEEANQALLNIKHSRVSGSTVLVIHQ